MIGHSVRVVLVETSHPGNIGASARAMKTMGLSKLYLVSPLPTLPSEVASAMSSGAEDVLNNACITPSLLQAVTDCEYVVGLSARKRGISLPTLDPRQAAKQWVERVYSKQTVALVFGREDRGLKNVELDLCQQQVCIDANHHYSSLNLAAAVQVICYELRQAWHMYQGSCLDKNAVDKNNYMASVEAKEDFFTHLQEVLQQIDFLKGRGEEKMMKKIRHIYNRAELTKVELNILRGILTQTQRNF